MTSQPHESGSVRINIRLAEEVLQVLDTAQHHLTGEMDRAYAEAAYAQFSALWEPVVNHNA